jgi:hypothetical protein
VVASLIANHYIAHNLTATNAGPTTSTFNGRISNFKVVVAAVMV